MNRLLIISLSIISFLNLNAQEAFIPLNFNALSKKIATSNNDITNPKKNVIAKTWVKRGELMQQSFLVDLEETIGGMPPYQLKLFYKEPLKETKEELNGVTYDVLEYERMHYYFLDDALVMWKRIKSIEDNPLDKAFTSYVKAIELDKGNKLSDDIKTNLVNLKGHYNLVAINDYYSGKKELALVSFEKILEINKLPLLNGVKDTLMIKYAGIIARELGDYPKALDYYKQLSQIQKDPNTYLQIKDDYISIQDTANAILTMEEAFSVFPDTIAIISNVVDLYSRTNRIEDGISLINKSIERDSTNGLLYYWKGRLILKMPDEDRIEKALEMYNKAIVKTPDLSYAYFDIGFIHFLVGQEYFLNAGEEKDLKMRELMNNEGLEKYKKALPMFDKAIELGKNDKVIIKESYDTLKRIYYKLQMMDKYEEVNQKLKALSL